MSGVLVHADDTVTTVGAAVVLDEIVRSSPLDVPAVILMVKFLSISVASAPKPVLKVMVELPPAVANPV